VAIGPDPDVEQRFEVLEILVVGAEQRLDTVVRDGDSSDDGSRRYVGNSL
jgi:hypothetical protein